MAILRAAKPLIRRRSIRSERGMTLLELLIALSIFAAVASLSGVALTGTLTNLRHERAAEQLVSDLRRASLLARTRGVETQIRMTSDGYAIAALDIERTWPRDVSAVWRVREAGMWQVRADLALPPRTIASPDLQVELRRAEALLSVRIEPVTGRVHAG